MLGSWLKGLNERLRAGAERIASDCGLPTRPSQTPLLAALYRNGPMTVGDAVQALGISQPVVAEILSCLLDLGSVEASRDARDQRGKRISLSQASLGIELPSGRPLAPQHPAEFAPIFAQAEAAAFGLEEMLIPASLFERRCKKSALPLDVDDVVTE